MLARNAHGKQACIAEVGEVVEREGGVAIVDDGAPPPDRPGQGVRIGLTNGADLPWRWWVPGDPNVSKPVPVPVAPRRAGASRSSS